MKRSSFKYSQGTSICMHKNQTDLDVHILNLSCQWPFWNQDTYQNSPSCSNFNPIFSHSDLLILDHSGELQNII